MTWGTIVNNKNRCYLCNIVGHNANACKMRPEADGGTCYHPDVNNEKDGNGRQVPWNLHSKCQAYIDAGRSCLGRDFALDMSKLSTIVWPKNEFHRGGGGRGQGGSMRGGFRGGRGRGRNDGGRGRYVHHDDAQQGDTHHMWAIMIEVVVPAEAVADLINETIIRTTTHGRRITNVKTGEEKEVTLNFFSLLRLASPTKEI